MPPILGRVHPKRLTPYVAIIAFGAVACVLLLLPGNTINLLADLYAFGAMISFTVAHVSVVWLRHKEPDFPRPFRTPINIQVGKMSVPVLAVIGGLGTFTVWCVVVATHPFGRTIGFIWMGVGLLMYVGYRKAKGYSSDQDRREGRGPGQHADRHRLRPDPRAHHRLRASATR